MRFISLLSGTLICVFAMGFKNYAYSGRQFLLTKTKAVKSIAETGNTYFISQDGNDNNAGTSASAPWKTIAKLNTRELLPGDKVYFMGGQTFTGNFNINDSGAGKELIEITSYGTGKAILKAGAGSGIYIHNSADISIRNLTIAGDWVPVSQSGNTGSGIGFYNDLPNAARLGSVYISNCEISGFRNGGIGIISAPNDKSQSGYRKVVIDSNVVHDNGKFGIALVGLVAPSGSNAYAFAGVYVAYNKIYNNTGIVEINNTHTGDGLIIGDTNGGTIEHNVAYHNGWLNGSNSGGPCGIWGYDATNLIFQYNESYNNGTSPGKADGDGFDLDGGTTNCIMQYNYSHDNYGAGFLIWEYGDTRVNNSKNLVRFNISQNDNTNNNFYAGIVIGSDGGSKVSGTIVYNNTIYSNKGSSVKIYGGLNTRLYNNIFYCSQSNVPIIVTATNSCFFLGNDYYNPNGFMVNISGEFYAALNDFRRSHNEIWDNKTYGLDIDPGFKDPGKGAIIGTGNPASLTNYSLNQGSGVINAGFDLSPIGFVTGDLDFNGIKIPGKKLPDMGACQYH